VFASAVGPWFFSRLESITGNYTNASLGCLAITMIIFVASFFVRNPQDAFRAEQRV
jgi:cyanate permease